MRGLPSLKCLNLIRVGDAAREFTQRPTKLVGNGTRGHARHRDLMPSGNFPYVPLLALWVVVGIGYSVTQTPTGRLIRRSAHPEDRPALFAAQFALSHATWLVTYPLAGWLGAKAGLPAAFLVMAGIAAVGLAMGLRLWPANDPDELEHSHHDLPAGHPHVQAATAMPDGYVHTHAFVVDAEHVIWPGR